MSVDGDHDERPNELRIDSWTERIEARQQEFLSLALVGTEAPKGR